MVSSTDDAEFAPRSAARAEHAPARPRPRPGRGLGRRPPPEPLPPLLPPIPLPTDGDGPLPRRGHPGDPGFTVAGPPDGASVWQQAQFAWQAAGAEWSTPSDAAWPAPPVTPAPAPSAPSPDAASSAPDAPPGTRTRRPRRGRRRLLLTAVVLVLAVAVAWAGYVRFGPHELSPRTYPPAQTASTQFPASPGPSGRGLFQTLTRVSSVGNTVVAVGSQAGGDLARGQVFF